MSICTWLNLHSGSLKFPVGDEVCRCTLAFWQDSHAGAQARQSFLAEGQTYLSSTDLAVALTPG